MEFITFSDWLHLKSDFIIKFIACLFCGALFGLERKSRNKPVDIKTGILIATGSMLFTEVSLYAPGQLVDQSRVMAQIVSGIGFLGGGVIIIRKDMVVGLTTAATIWMLAAIGMMIGIGQIHVAVITSIAITLFLALESSAQKFKTKRKRRKRKTKDKDKKNEK